LAPEAQSKVRHEKKVADAEPQKGCPGVLRNIPSFAPTPLLHNPKRDSGGPCEGLCSSTLYNAEPGHIGCEIFAIPCFGPDRTLTYTAIHPPPDCASHWPERSI
jgi:hypothetical protein